MLNVYLKNLRKNWLQIFGPILIAGFICLIALSWSSMKDLIIERVLAMDNPIYIAILGNISVGNVEANAWQAGLFMYAAGTANIVILFSAILIPARMLSNEIDKNTLDVVLSYPIPRWRYLLEKYSVYCTYSLFYPILLFITMSSTTIILGEKIDYFFAFNYALGLWFQLFALGAVSLLCTSIFLESNRSLAVAGIINLGQYFLETVGGLIPALNDLRVFSLFHYLNIGAIINAGMLPLDEVVIVLIIGIVALASALYIFHKREFAI